MNNATGRDDSERKGGKAFAFALGLALFATVLMLGLTYWQIQRLAWKTDLIARVEARVHADPVALPASSEWAGLKPSDYEYRHVSVTGTYIPDAQSNALALTERGSGFWVMTPMRLASGEILYVNRGFVTQAQQAGKPGADQPVTITGLMRVPETGGLFLRPNDPAKGRWYSRDVAAMAKASGLDAPAPFFIDRDADADRDALPIGGMTRIAFPNNHLLYAIQFFLLALISAGGAVFLLRTRARNANGNKA